MVQLRSVVIFLLVNIIKGDFIVDVEYSTDLDAVIDGFDGFDEDFKSIIRTMSSIYTANPKHDFSTSCFNESNILTDEKILEINMEVIIQLKSLSEKARSTMSDKLNDFIINDNKLLSPLLSESQRSKLMLITYRHSKSMELYERSFENDGSVALKVYDDFINSVFGACNSLPEILSLISSSLPHPNTSKFNNLLKKVLQLPKANSSYWKNEFTSLQSALIQTEVYGFVTIAHAYWLRQLLGDGNFSHELDKIKDQILERIKVHGNMELNIRNALMTLQGCERQETKSGKPSDLYWCPATTNGNLLPFAVHHVDDDKTIMYICKTLIKSGFVSGFIKTNEEVCHYENDDLWQISENYRILVGSVKEWRSVKNAEFDEINANLDINRGHGRPIYMCRAKMEYGIFFGKVDYRHCYMAPHGETKDSIFYYLHVKVPDFDYIAS